MLTTLPVIWLAKRFGAGYSQISRRVQDQQGDLATLTEEAATGMRVVKAFGRGPLMQDRFGASARTLRGSALEMVRLRARFWGWLTLVPNVTMASAVLIGGIAVAHGSLSLGALVAFTTLLVLLAVSRSSTSAGSCRWRRRQRRRPIGSARSSTPP